MKFNAAGDGKTNDTSAVRAALAAAENSNGGRVIFDANYTFLTGCFNVTSNIILDIRGTLLAYNNSDGYVPVQPLPWYGGGPDAQESGNMEWQSFIRSYNANNITITGGGLIDGQGDDAIAVKSGKDYLGRTYGRTTENVLVRNFTVGTTAGLAIGSEMSAGIRNVTFKDIVMNGSAYGISMKSDRGRGVTRASFLTVHHVCLMRSMEL
uniref:Pectate lyase superfamily protein domain-containing protein n=1 Tax=Acrobeloides nanus TaxID=290746 RepID=A0A914D545_9BILA